MVTTLDRYLLRSLMTNYVTALAIMISLYIALDLFVNIDEFTEQSYPLPEVIRNVAGYYAPNIFLYFAQLSGVITLFACMATIARARKQNELTAMLATGTSLYRVAAPIIAFGLTTTSLLVLDTELAIPSVAHLLARDHDDADGRHTYEVLFLPDRNNALVSASKFHPATQDLRRLLVMTVDENGSIASTIEADHATWEPSPDEGTGGRWKLDRGILTTRLRTESSLGPQEEKDRRPIYYYESDLSPDIIQLRQSEGWINLLSLAQLRQLYADGIADHAAITQTRHSRIATPIVSMVLLLLGLPFFLDRSPANVLSDAGKCMLLCGLCYVLTFIAQSIRIESGSAFPFWIPIFVFSTVAMILIDRIRT